MATINDDRPIPGADLEGLFKAPPPPIGPRMDDETTTSSSTSSPSTSSRPGGNGAPYGTLSPKPATPADTHTLTSPTSPRGDARAAGKAILAILGALVLVADALLVRSAGRRLRRPTRAQMDAVATPAGRLAYRHGAAAVLGEDVGDIVAIAGGVADWMLDGPLTHTGPQVEFADDEYDVERVDQGAAPYVTMPATVPAAPAAAEDTPHVTYLT